MSNLVLVPELEDKIRPLFETEEALDKFQQEFARDMAETLDNQREARARSVEESRKKWVRS